MFNKRTYEWKSELDRLKKNPDRRIFDVLQKSFDRLQEIEKKIFLNIVCFFNYKNQKSVIKILDCLDLYPKIGLRVLIDKSLIKLYYQQLWMSNLIQEMGWDIVWQETPKEPRKHNRLWFYKDIDYMLTKNTV